MTSDAKAAKRKPTVLVAIAAVVVLAGVALAVFTTGTLRWSDPAGAKACTMLSDAINSGPLTLKTAMDIGDVAKESTTQAIRATVDVDTSRGADLDALVDLEKFHAACVESGVDMPPFPEWGSRSR